ncbi:MAG: SDR family NAD(P)-dependent oxidoreductase, partial [Bacteroidota bacterium]
FIMEKHVVQGMIKRQKGKIINICSMMSEMVRDIVGFYAAVKGGSKMPIYQDEIADLSVL